jgi:hypothetical protein
MNYTRIAWIASLSLVGTQIVAFADEWIHVRDVDGKETEVSAQEVHSKLVLGKRGTTVPTELCSSTIGYSGQGKYELKSREGQEVTVQVGEIRSALNIHPGARDQACKGFEDDVSPAGHSGTCSPPRYLTPDGKCTLQEGG